MADEALERGLLPEGLRDALPPEAEQADWIERRLLDCFTSHGYDQVKPPMVEFEQSLSGRLDMAAKLDMFRLLDPESQRTMVLRSDITGQIARIAATRLGHVERPLRLSYAGTALRVKGSQLRPERQFGQAGIELIGPRSQEAAVEVVLLAHEALGVVGVSDVSIDLVFPKFVPQLAEELGLDAEETALVSEALDAKDVGLLQGLSTDKRRIFEGVLGAAGPATEAVAQLDALLLPPKSSAIVLSIKGFVAALKSAAANLEVTIDPGEQRGFAYQGDFGFSLFAPGNKVELGRGGRYGIRKPDGDVEPATGFTLYMDSLCRSVPLLAARDKLLLSCDILRSIGAKLRKEGWTTVQALAPVPNLRDEARRLGCAFYWQDGAAQKVSD